MNERYETFTLLIARIGRCIRRIQNQEMADYGLRSAHIACLHTLYLAGPLTAAELCERCDEDKATISRALVRLEQEGYIAAESSASKRYKTPLYLTDKGSAIARQIGDKIDRVLEEVSQALSEEERLAFYRSLSLISDQLDLAVRRRNA